MEEHSIVNNVANNRKINLIENNSINKYFYEDDVDNNYIETRNKVNNEFMSPKKKEKSEILISNCLSQIVKNPEKASDIFVSNIISHSTFCADLGI